MMMYKHTFVSAWIVSILKELGGMCEENFVVPIIAMFYNDSSTFHILNCKRSAASSRASLLEQRNDLKHLPWYRIGTRFIRVCELKWAKLRLQFSEARYNPNVEAVSKCLDKPEFQFLKYIHKLFERMTVWRSFSDKDLPYEELPLEFRSVLGPLDPPHAEYSHLVQIKEFADAFMSPNMQQTLFVLLLSEKLQIARQLDPSHRA
jgi:hypothetical protein